MGRPKGVPNRTTTALKDAILLAAEQTGRDGQGGEGLTGYLRRLADDEPKAFSALLGKVLPLQVTGADGNALQVTGADDGPLVVQIVRFSDAST